MSLPLHRTYATATKIKRRNIRTHTNRRTQLRIEALEDRRTMAGDSITPIVAMDINHDGQVSAVDALQVINALNIGQPDSRFDVSGDGQVSALDALTIINFLNNRSSSFSPISAEPNASVDFPNEIRQREIVSLRIDSIAGINPSSILELRIDWGDGLNDAIETQDIVFPLQRSHVYYSDPATLSITIAVETNDGSVIPIHSRSAALVANSPPVIDHVDDGLFTEIFGNTSFEDVPNQTTIERIDPTVHFDFGNGLPDPSLVTTDGSFSIRWRGFFTPAHTGDHLFFASVGLNDSAAIYLDDSLVLTATGNDNSASITLTAGEPVSIRVDYVAGAGPSHIRVGNETDRSFKTALPSNSLSPLKPASELRGGVLAEHFPVTVGDTIADFRDSPAFQSNTPLAAVDRTDFAYSGSSESFNPSEVRASRVRAILSPPSSGLYTFHLAASDDAELWLSHSPDSGSSERIAQVNTPTPVQGFNDAHAGTSQPIYLVAGQPYFIETLHIHNNPASVDHVSVGWTRPDQISLGRQLVPLESLRPVTPVVTLHAEVSQTHEADIVSRNARWVISRSDDLGRSLSVPYTLGGSAMNGIDYQALSGIAVIPAGQRSVTIELDPIDDDILEGTETVLVRLATNPRYQLGVESERQIEISIAGEFQNETQLVPQEFNTFISAGFVVAASGNSILPYRETDSTLPFANTSGNNAYRASVVNATPNSPWQTLIGLSFDGGNFPPETSFLASVWARSANTDGSIATVGLRLQKNGDGFAGEERVWQVGNQWTLLLLPMSPDFGTGTLNRTVDVRVGYQTQTVELGGFSLVKVNSLAELTAAPTRINTYGGRDRNSQWRETSMVQAATLRTKPVEILVVNAKGDPIPGAVVTVTPTTPGLPLGTTVTPERIVSTNLLSSTDDSRRYAALLETFDSLTDAGTAQWGPWELNPDVPQEFLDWVVERDLPYHGHALLWGEFSDGPNDNFPTRYSLRTGYETALANPNVDEVQWLKDEILRHIEITGPGAFFSGARTGNAAPLVTWWDVINHPIFFPEFTNIVGQDFLVEVLAAARATVHPDTDLIINEFDILSDPINGLSDDFFDLLTLLDSVSISDTGQPAAYDTIGFQSHFVSNRLPSIDRMMTELGRYQVFDRTLQITEFDVDALDIDRQTQADFTRDFFQTVMATDGLTAATIWGFWAGDHWREDAANNNDERAALFNQDWSPRPNGQWLLDHFSEARRPVSTSTNAAGLVQNVLSATTAHVSIRLPNGIVYETNIDTTTDTPIEINTNGFVVNSVDDPTLNSILIDGQCGNSCTLREAILESNAVPGANVITFDFPGTSPAVISLNSALPIITDQLGIDATSHTAYVNEPLVAISGQSRTFKGDGLRFTAGASGSVVTGLAIYGFLGDAIQLDGDHNIVTNNYLGITNSGEGPGNGGDGLRLQQSSGNLATGNVIGRNDGSGIFIGGEQSNENTITGNQIGVDPTGTAARPNEVGIFIGQGSRNQIGIADQGNLVSGNASHGIVITGVNASNNTVMGNIVGLSGDSDAALPNQRSGISIQRSGNNSIGGSEPGHGNVISGNHDWGIRLQGSDATGNLIAGNRIGTDATGTLAIGNLRDGIFIVDSPQNQIGTSAAGGGNLISGNLGSGIIVVSSGSTANVIEGNRIGTTLDGLGALGNQRDGVLISRASGNLLGGSEFGSRNQISANGRSGVSIASTTANANRLEGNWIGLDANGAPLGNTDHGVQVRGGNGNQVGTEATGNIISGNGQAGIDVRGVATQGTLILNNRIGTDPDGLVAVANAGNGVSIFDRADDTQIGSGSAGNQISGNGRHGIQVSGRGVERTIIQGNAIGVSVDENARIANGGIGIIIMSQASQTLIGGDRQSGQGNVIGGNPIGIRVTNESNDNSIVGNMIGTDRTGIATTIGNNAQGISIQLNSNDNEITDNVIAYNNVGIQVTGTTHAESATGNRIQQNSIHSNTRIGIDIGSFNATANDPGDLDVGSNRQQNTPQLNSAILSSGTLQINYTVDSLPTQSTYPLKIEWFESDGSGQGRVYLGVSTFTESNLASGSANAILSDITLTFSNQIVAIATDTNGNSSEFSSPIAV